MREAQKNLPSVKEIILSRGRLNNNYAMPEYDIPAYDGKMLNYKHNADPVSEWRKDKGLHYFEEIAKKKSALPPPDKYNNMPKEAQLAPSLYKFDNKTYAAALIDKLNDDKHIGPGYVDPKKEKKVLGNYTNQARFTMAEVIEESAKPKVSPDRYKLPRCVSIDSL